MGSRLNKVSKPETKSVRKNSSQGRKSRNPDSTRSGNASAVPQVKKSSNNGPRYKFSTDIPQKYDQDYVCAIPRDPLTSFVYWEFTPETLKRKTSESQLGSKIVLTVKGRQEDRQPASHHFDICRNSFEQFINVPGPGEPHRFEFGTINSHGNYSFISETGTLPPPQTDVSKTIDQKWFSEKTEQLIQFSAKSSMVKRSTVKAHSEISDNTPYLGSSSF
ncbi:MAG: DUF4912 domain-containing protein [Fibrobacter sp.]|nr:DUF4912 domain-containing protein [Fibrobacter sp.]